MPISDWPKEDRPREKLLIKGELALTDAELIAIFLKTGSHGKTALDIAKELLVEYGSLKQLLRASASHLLKKHGLGTAKYAALKAAVELGRRYLTKNLCIGEAIKNSSEAENFLSTRLKDYSHEVFACLFMDIRLHVIRYEELFYGTINEAPIYPREIVKRGLAYNAAKVIIAHNHPSGCAIPSLADKEMTQLIIKTLALVDIEVLDHIVIGHSKNFSFSKAGLL